MESYKVVAYSRNLNAVAKEGEGLDIYVEWGQLYYW